MTMTHPSRNFFALSFICVLCMFVWLKVQGFESYVDKDLLKNNDILMRIFHLVNSFIVSRNLWPTSLSKILLFLNLVKKLKNPRIQNMCSVFLWLQWLLSYQQFCDFLLNKRCKIYMRPMLPPGSRNWQLIYPHSNDETRGLHSRLIRSAVH